MRSRREMQMQSKLALAAALALMATGPAAAGMVKTQKATLQVDTIAKGLNHPWAVAVLPDGAYLVTERPGRMRIIRNGAISDALSGLPDIAAIGQGGLLDVELDPKFSANRTIYFTATVGNADGVGTAVFRALLSDDEKTLSAVKRIFVMSRLTPGGLQFGARIAIAPDGSLFVGLGDRGEMDRAQDFRDDAGAIIHINADGSIPADNPFRDGTRALPEIWSKGHRNAEGITFDSADGALYTVEHGAKGGDEINHPEAGKNYGWPVITYGRDYSGAKIGVGTAKAGMEQPLFYWDPSIAPGAIAVYRGGMFPEWNGDFIVAALKFQLLSRLERNHEGRIEEKERFLKDDYGRLRDVVVAPDGALLVTTDERDGSLLRISRAAE